MNEKVRRYMTEVKARRERQAYRTAQVGKSNRNTYKLRIEKAAFNRRRQLER